MKIISQILVVAIINLTCTYSYAWVDTTATTVAIHKNSVTQVFRQQLLDMTNRDEVIEQLVQYGVSKEEAIRRINSLTDEEIETYLSKIDALPSGGQEFREGPVGQFFLIVVFSPILIFLGMAWVISRVILPVLCLVRLDEYKSCLEDPDKLMGSSSPIVSKEPPGPSQGATCLEPCYSDFNDCMDSSDDTTEENQCDEEKTMCIQQCEGDFN
jgi:Family of unknown function (DUF6627)